ncbi:hypothetical protein BC567DRAFT_246486 [Phyllosticta citribraziliensis]
MASLASFANSHLTTLPDPAFSIGHDGHLRHHFVLFPKVPYSSSNYTNSRYTTYRTDTLPQPIRNHPIWTIHIRAQEGPIDVLIHEAVEPALWPLLRNTANIRQSFDYPHDLLAARSLRFRLTNTSTEADQPANAPSQTIHVVVPRLAPHEWNRIYRIYQYPRAPADEDSGVARAFPHLSTGAVLRGEYLVRGAVVAPTAPLAPFGDKTPAAYDGFADLRGVRLPRSTIDACRTWARVTSWHEQRSRSSDGTKGNAPDALPLQLPLRPADIDIDAALRGSWHRSVSAGLEPAFPLMAEKDDERSRFWAAIDAVASNRGVHLLLFLALGSLAIDVVARGSFKIVDDVVPALAEAAADFWATLQEVWAFGVAVFGAVVVVLERRSPSRCSPALLRDAPIMSSSDASADTSDTSDATSTETLSPSSPAIQPADHSSTALIGGLELEIEEHVQLQIASNAGVRSFFAIGPDASARNMIYFFPEYEFQRSVHPYSYRMRAFYHPFEFIPRHSQVWTIHTRVNTPYNAELYIVEDLEGGDEWPHFNPSPKPDPYHLPPLPDLKTKPGEENHVHYLPLLRDARGGLSEDVVVHVPKLAPGEPNRVYRFYLYPWRGARRSGGGLESHYKQYYVDHGAYPEVPRCAVVAPPSAGDWVAHADGYIVSDLMIGYCEWMGYVADWVEGCIRAGAAGYDLSAVPEPVDEDSDGNWGPALSNMPGRGVVGSQSVSDLTSVETDEEEPFYLDLLYGPRTKSGDVFGDRSCHLLRLFALARADWKEVRDDAWEDEEAYYLGLLYDPRKKTKDLEDEDSFNLRRLFGEPEEDVKLYYSLQIYYDGMADLDYDADDETSEYMNPIPEHYWFALG